MLFIYLFLSEPYRSNTEGGQGRQFDSSCDRPALPYSFSLLAVLSCATLTPHATSQPQLFYHYIHIYLHQINTLTFHPRHLSVSFYVFW